MAMKTKDVAKKYGFDQQEFEAYIKSVGAGKVAFSGLVIDDVLVHVEKFQELQKQKQEEMRKAEKEMIKNTSTMLISSGFSFDGYKIVKYSGYISGDDCITIPRDSFLSDHKVEDYLCECLVKIRRQAIKELKEAAYNLGCNAVVGVDFDYLTMDPQHKNALNGSTVYEPYVICVTANGNAVVIEKE